MSKVLLSLGHGFSAQALDEILIPEGWRVVGTTRSDEGGARLAARGVEPRIWGVDDLSQDIKDATHILVSIAPKGDGDPVLNAYQGQITRAHPEWVGYLSTTGVYGDHAGNWVDETTPLSPSTKRGEMRRDAEAAWSALDLPLHIFRLAGIYGPGRGPFTKIKNGTARRIIKPNQIFSRIHVEDIAQTLAASIKAPRVGAIYNLCDDNPAPPEEVIGYAAKLLGAPLPPAEDFETAEMTPMARSFYAESKKVRNDLIKSELGVVLKYPTYQAGLDALLDLV